MGRGTDVQLLFYTFHCTLRLAIAWEPDVGMVKRWRNISIIPCSIQGGCFLVTLGHPYIFLVLLENYVYP